MLRLALVSLVALSLPVVSPTSAEIDAQVWSPIAASVVAGDIVAMGRTYHPAAVLVSATGTKPIATTLEGWGNDMVVAKKDGVRATVELRFDKRQDDATGPAPPAGARPP